MQNILISHSRGWGLLEGAGSSVVEHGHSKLERQVSTESRQGALCAALRAHEITLVAGVRANVSL
jgi:hypothetical protein